MITVKLKDYAFLKSECVYLPFLHKGKGNISWELKAFYDENHDLIFYSLSTYYSKLGLPRPRKRLLELLAKTALDAPAPALASAWASAQKEWRLRFLLSPVEVLAGADGQTVCGLKLAHNRLEYQVYVYMWCSWSFAMINILQYKLIMINGNRPDNVFFLHFHMIFLLLV